MKRKNIRRLRHLLHILRWWREHTTALRRAMAWIAKKLGFLRFLGYINPLRYIKVLDWYIIRKFIGTYIYSIALIISISIVFDVNDAKTQLTCNEDKLLRAVSGGDTRYINLKGLTLQAR